MLCHWVVVSLCTRTSASHFRRPALPITTPGWRHLGRCPLIANRPNGCEWSSESRPPDKPMKKAGRTFVKMSGLSSYLTMDAEFLLPVSLPPPPGALFNDNTSPSFQIPR